MSNSKTALKRQLGLYGVIALAAGGVLGGWLAEAPYWFELTGVGAAVLFPVLALVLIPVGLAFAELTAMLPFTSAVDVWSSNAMNPKMGWAAQWMFFLVQVVEPPLVSFIFVIAFNYFVEIPDVSKPLIAIVIIVLWYLLTIFKNELTGCLAIICCIVMVRSTLLYTGYYCFSGHLNIKNIT